MPLQYVKHEKLYLRKHPEFSEVWLHDRINDEPSILGLGEVEVIERERVQAGAGRLDFLLYDEASNTRYEVEIMLGATDPSHILRCIEYWDIERRRYPAYDHVAVLVAEEVTTRFLNLMALLAGSIPMIAIQLDALRVGDNIVLNFIQVLDQSSLRRDDSDGAEGEETNRSYWENRVGAEIIRIADEVSAMINEKAVNPQALTYKKHHMGITAGASYRNFIGFKPRKQFLHINAWVTDATGWKDRFEEFGIPASSLSQPRSRPGRPLNPATGPRDFRKPASAPRLG